MTLRILILGFAVSGALGCVGYPAAVDGRAFRAPQSPQTSRVTCHSEAVTGSRIRRKRCFTAAEREHMARQSQEWVLSGGAGGATYEPASRKDPRQD